MIVIATIVGCKPEETDDHCKNNLKDEDETGIDCGGSCPDSCYIYTGRKVYVCGYQGDVAKYWIDSTTEVILSDSTLGPAQALDIFVYGNDVYVCGFQKEGSFNVAKYWKNGVETKLTNGTKHATATHIVVVNGDVYVAGAERDNKFVAKYWKNGTPTSLTDGVNNAYGNCIYVDGQTVYVSGSEAIGAYEIGKYWVNGGVTNVTASNKIGYCYAIAAANGKVYVTANEDMVCWYQVDGTVNNLTGGTFAEAMEVDGNDVYVCGSTFGATNNALYWKNGNLVTLASGNSHEAHDIDVVGIDVYVCGEGDNSDNILKYWRNGEEVVVSQSTKFGRANGIFVKEF